MKESKKKASICIKNNTLVKKHKQMDENIRMWRSMSRSSNIVCPNYNFEIFDFRMFWNNIKMGTWN